MVERPDPAGASGPIVQRWGVDTRAAGVVGVGWLAVLAGFLAFDWFRGDVSFPTSPNSTAFRDVPAFLDSFEAAARRAHVDGYFSTSASHAYFSWLGWVLLVASVLTSWCAVSAPGERWSVHWLAVSVSATGLGVTLLALDLIIVQGNPPPSIRLPSYSDYLRDTSIGAWLAAGGFLVISVGALLPRREPSDTGR